MICFITSAYNAETTIERTIRSVIDQTYADFEYYIFDNGSTDETGNIIKKYAAADKRIVPFYHNDNEPSRIFDYIGMLLEKYKDGYLIDIDSDDEYDTRFLEKMVSFMKEYGLDFAATGSAFIDAQNGQLICYRMLSNDLIFDSPDAYSDLPAYHAIMRPIWAKLFSFDLLRKIDFDLIMDMAYGADTYISLSAMIHSKKCGVLAGSYHKYYVNPRSDSFNFRPHRIEDNRFLYDLPRKLLEQKANGVSPQNENFLLCVYLSDSFNTLITLINCTGSDTSRKLDHMCDIFLCEQMKKLSAYEYFDDFNALRKRQFFSAAAHWLLSIEEINYEQAEKYLETGEFVCAACENTGGWLSFKKLRMKYYLDSSRKEEARSVLDELLEIIPDDPDIIYVKNLYK